MFQHNLPLAMDDYATYCDMMASDKPPHPRALQAKREPINFAAINELFTTAVKAGKSKPVLTCGDLKLSLAPQDGNNPGFIYVKLEGVYQGKLSPQGRFSNAREATHAKEVRAELRALADNPAEYLTVTGKETGTCCCCGRELTDPKSIAAGIGPICAENWGVA